MEEEVLLKNEYLADNVKNYIEKAGKALHWVINRSGLTEEEYAGIMKGEYTEERLAKLNKLFRIKDQNYFLTKVIKLPRSLEEIEAMESTEVPVYVPDPRILKVEEIEIQLAQLMEKHQISYDSPLGKDILEVMTDARYKTESAKEIKRNLMEVVKSI